LSEIRQATSAEASEIYAAFDDYVRERIAFKETGMLGELTAVIAESLPSLEPDQIEQLACTVRAYIDTNSDRIADAYDYM